MDDATERARLKEQIVHRAGAGASVHVLQCGTLMSAPSPRHPMPVVLIVDDHADTREMYTTFLDTMGLASMQAGTCAEALARAEAADVLVLDRRLPDGDGHDVVRKLRADPRTRALPIILLSGDPGGGASGADAWLLKPVVPDVLYEEITRLLASRRT